MTNVGRGCLLTVTDAELRAAPLPRTVPESVHCGAVGTGATGLELELPQPSAVNARAVVTTAVRIWASLCQLSEPGLSGFKAVVTSRGLLNGQEQTVSPLECLDQGWFENSMITILHRNQILHSSCSVARGSRRRIRGQPLIFKRDFTRSEEALSAAGALWSPLRQNVESVTSRRWWGSPSRSSSRHATDGS